MLRPERLARQRKEQRNRFWEMGCKMKMDNLAEVLVR
jgi:hypothetical protein